MRYEVIPLTFGRGRIVRISSDHENYDHFW
jgi:hypothetical protein